MSGSLTIASGNSAVFPIGFGYYPPEGSRVISSRYSWATLTSYQEDLSFAVSQGIETSIQAAFIDNSTNPVAVVMFIFGTGQRIVIPGYSQGLVPVLFTGAPAFTISVPVAASGYTGVDFLNVTTGGAEIWAAASAGPFATAPTNNVFNASALGINASTVIKASPGRLFNLLVTANLTPGTGAYGLYDSATLGAANITNAIWTNASAIATGGLAIGFAGFPFFNGLVYLMTGTATGTVSVGYT